MLFVVQAASKLKFTVQFSNLYRTYCPAGPHEKLKFATQFSALHRTHRRAGSALFRVNAVALISAKLRLDNLFH